MFFSIRQRLNNQVLFVFKRFQVRNIFPVGRYFESTFPGVLKKLVIGIWLVLGWLQQLKAITKFIKSNHLKCLNIKLINSSYR